uniref:Putative methyltransferase n=1 Tax=viral metagenome TaxID=1070528 RepID=A0A6M3LAH4_9ZZZZ
MGKKPKPGDLIQVSKIKRMLAECTDLRQIKSIRDQAEALRQYAKVADESLDIQNSGAEIKLRAERRGGELLRAMEKAKGTRGQLSGGTTVVPPGNSPTLADLGLSKNQASRWQKEAAVDEKTFETFVTETKEAEKELTTSGLLKLARRQEHAETVQAALSTGGSTRGTARWKVTDKQDAIDCDVLITDPPYGILAEEWEPDQIEDFTRDWLSRWAECGADFILSFFSQRYLWDGRQWFDESLLGYKFQQLLVWHCPNNKSPQSRQGFKQTWEPIFFYRRHDSDRQIKVNVEKWGDKLTDFDCCVAAVPQENFTEADEKMHPAQKPLAVMRWLIAATSGLDELICDPFCGSGTTGIAACELGRRFHGIEMDEQYRSIAKARIKKYGVV